MIPFLKRKDIDNEIEEKGIEYDVDDADDKLLLLADELNELANEANQAIPNGNKEEIQLDVPKIVVMGAQSSGKSSFLNCLIKYDLMPTGHQMITKNPIYVRMYKIKKEQNLDECVKISTYENDTLTTHKTILLNSDNYQSAFKDEFEKITNKLVGKWDNISTKPIYVDVYSFKVSNLTLVDLPGIVAVAKTDRGQSADIVRDIKALVESEVTKKNTYVVLCIGASPDIETDIGLSTFKDLKRINPELRAITLFTKLDMLKDDRLSQFQNILKLGLSKDLQTDDGYFCVSSKFDTTDFYYDHLGDDSVVIKNKLYGVKNFFIFLKRKIIGSIKRSFNKLRDNMGKFIEGIRSLNPQLSNDLKNISEKRTFVVHNIYILSRAIHNSFNAIGHDNNVAHDFKMAFKRYAKAIQKLDPFSTSNLPDAKLQEIMDNFDGYLPGTKVTATAVINKCLTDRDLSPMSLIVNASIVCIEEIKQIIINLVKKLIEAEKLDIHQLELNSFSVPVYQFPNLKEVIVRTTMELVKKYEADALKVIKDFILIQEKQVWVKRRDLEGMYASTISLESKLNESEANSMITDDDDKLNYDVYLGGETAETKMKDDNISDFEIDPNSQQALVEMRFLTKIIYKRIAFATQNVALRTIITTLIKKLENHFFLELSKKTNSEDVNNYFYENEDKVKENEKIELILSKAEKIFTRINNFDFY
jgi:GTP-binding protein EngB required for normal cell division